jgi:hypothetical protein
MGYSLECSKRLWKKGLLQESGFNGLNREKKNLDLKERFEISNFKQRKGSTSFSPNKMQVRKG